MFSFLTYLIILGIGIMMANVYRYSVSNISMFKIEPERLHKAFWGAVLVGIVICAYLSYRTILSFREAGVAEDKLHLYHDNEQMLIFFLNLGFIVMIVLSNLSSMASKRLLWPFYIVTFLVYSLFAVIDNFFLEDVLFQFKKINQLWNGEFNLASIKGYLMLITTAVLCSFNALMISWGLKK